MTPISTVEHPHPGLQHEESDFVAISWYFSLTMDFTSLAFLMDSSVLIF